MNQIIITLCLGCACIYFIYNCIKGENPKIFRNICMICAMVLAIFYQYPIISENNIVKIIFMILIIAFLAVGVILTYKQNHK